MNRSEHLKSRSKDSISMNNVYKALLLVLCLLTLAGCSVSGNTPEGTPPSHTALPSITIVPSQTPSVKAIATATVSIQTPTLIPTETATKSQVTPREVNCFQPSFDNVAPIRTEGVDSASFFL